MLAWKADNLLPALQFPLIFQTVRKKGNLGVQLRVYSLIKLHGKNLTTSRALSMEQNWVAWPHCRISGVQGLQISLPITSKDIFQLLTQAVTWQSCWQEKSPAWIQSLAKSLSQQEISWMGITDKSCICKLLEFVIDKGGKILNMFFLSGPTTPASGNHFIFSWEVQINQLIKMSEVEVGGWDLCFLTHCAQLRNEDLYLHKSGMRCSDSAEHLKQGSWNRNTLISEQSGAGCSYNLRNCWSRGVNL